MFFSYFNSLSKYGFRINTNLSNTLYIDLVFCIPGRNFSGHFLKSWSKLINELQSMEIEWELINLYHPVHATEYSTFEVLSNISITLSIFSAAIIFCFIQDVLIFFNLIN